MFDVVTKHQTIFSKGEGKMIMTAVLIPATQAMPGIEVKSIKIRNST